MTGPDGARVPSPLLDQLDPVITNGVTIAQTVEDLVFDAIAWWKILEFGWHGYPTSVQRLDPNTVSTTPPIGRTPAPLPSGTDPRYGVVYVDGRPVSGAEIICFNSPNPAVLVAGARAIRRALLLDQAAAMYARNPRFMDYLTPADGAEEISDDEAEAILGKLQAARRKEAMVWIPKALQYNSVDAPTPVEMQLAELQKQAGLDLANALGVDAEYLGISTTSRTYANDVDRRRARLNDILLPYMDAITQRLSMGDVTPRGYRVSFDIRNFLRANPTERAAVNIQYLTAGVISKQEIRDSEEYGPMPEDMPAAAPAQDQPSGSGGAQNALVPSLTFDADRTLRFVDLPMRSFSVDRATRTIKGIALPYGVYTEKYGLKLRFAKNALKWGSDVSRVKMLRDHDVASAVGRAVRLANTGGALEVEFKIGRGPAGDEALALADDGVIDGLSVGVDFTDADVKVNPKDPNDWTVMRADLREVSLTALPAFDDARVTQVAASLTGGITMEPCSICGQQHAPGVACQTAPPTPAPAAAPAGITLTAEQFSQLLARPAPAPAAPAVPAGPEPRTPVNPTRGTLALVAEPAPYRFDRQGNLRPGSHEFSADLFAALKDHDQAAYDRALSFVQAQFDIVSTDVNELNPTTNRPDMYVDQRDFRYPLWDAISKGSLTSITPFTFPKFSSAAGLVGAHTEGVEPTSGTFVTTNATVTPSPVSGKAKISRETWDQGGNPQIGNLIWRQMQKGWYEALEAFAVTTLDAATPTGIDFSATPGLANDDLDQALTAALAALQFVRGGFSMDAAFTQIDLFKALVAATGADGRRLYPALGAANANGTVRGRWAGVDVNGVAFLPAWALAASGTVAASSYLFDREVVHGWASAPQKLTMDQHEVANVYLGIWGYKAAVISDIAGVREIIYDPS
jgi:HK97 family phage prohead protease